MVVPLVAREIAAAVGVLLVATSAASVIGTLIVPRPVANWLSRQIDRVVNAGFVLATKPIPDFRRRDRVLSAHAATLLICQLVAWLVMFFVGFSLIFYYGIAATLILFYVFEFTPLGRRLLFVGRGRSVSRLSGLRVTRIRWGSFIVCGAFAGLAGIMYAGSLGGADPASGQTFLLPAFAACFLGATAIRPGRFNAIGTFIAVYFLVSGITGLQLLGVQNFVQQLFYGGALVIAVALSQLARRRGATRAT